MNSLSQALDTWLANYHFREMQCINYKIELIFDADICSLIPPKYLACGRQHLTDGGKVVRVLSNPVFEKLGYGPEIPYGERRYSMLKVASRYATHSDLTVTNITYVFSAAMKPTRINCKQY